MSTGNKVEFEQHGGPETAKLLVNGQDITRWVQAVQLESRAGELPCAVLDLCVSLDNVFTLNEAYVKLVVLMPPGRELQVVDNEDGTQTYRGVEQKVDA